MKTEQILNLDYRKEEAKEIIQKVLRKIKPLSKYSEEQDIPLEAIEKVIRILSQKYEIVPQWMVMSLYESAVNVYSIGVKTSNNHQWLGNVYGMCLYEIFAKLVIKMYSEVKQGNVKQRIKTKEEEERELLKKQIKQAKEEEELE